MKIKDLFEGDVIKGNFGNRKQQTSMMKAFGSQVMNIMHDVGIHFYEKPSYFEDLEAVDGDYRPLNQVTFKKFENQLKKAKISLPMYTSENIWGGDPRGPQQKYLRRPDDEVCLVKFMNDKLYIIDTTQSTTYARMWILVND